jgi:hypothetical protein
MRCSVHHGLSLNLSVSGENGCDVNRVAKVQGGTMAYFIENGILILVTHVRYMVTAA